MKLIEAAQKKKGLPAYKYAHFLEAYDRHFQPFQERKEPVHLLEIGVKEGGSLYLWKAYFGNPKIFGLDINQEAARLSSPKEGIRVFVGDQGNADLLRKIHTAAGHLDIVIDDGSHRMKDQINTFKTLFPLLAPGGVYVIEDLHTAFWTNWGGGNTGEPNNTLGFLKVLIDKLTFWAKRHQHAPDPSGVPEPDSFEKQVESLHFYDSICFIKKQAEDYHKYDPNNPNHIHLLKL